MWRYVDFARFMAMLHSSALWFARLDKMQDHYEGIMPKGYFDKLMAAFDTLAVGQPAFKAKADDARPHLQREYAQRSRQSVYVNCWHLSDFESGAMWKIYSDNAIAIRSTFSCLRDSFKAEPNFDVWIGVMKYVDFDNPVEFLNLKEGPSLYKRQIYDFEKEIRAVIHRNHGGTEPGPAGLEVPVRLDTLIDAVYVGPGRPEWFARLVKEMLERFGLPDIPVQRSGMDGKPLYLS